MAKVISRWRVEVVLAAARWAQNMLVEVQGNHAAHIPASTREQLHAAINELAEIPHTIPTWPVRPIDPLIRASAERMAEAERKAVRRGR